MFIVIEPSSGNGSSSLDINAYELDIKEYKSPMLIKKLSFNNVKTINEEISLIKESLAQFSGDAAIIMIGWCLLTTSFIKLYLQDMGYNNIVITKGAHYGRAGMTFDEYSMDLVKSFINK